MTGKTVMEPARLIGLDWGTSSLRAYLMGEGGQILAESCAASGVLHLERFRRDSGEKVSKERLFEAALDDVCRGWAVNGTENLPVIACGMVGSNAGWKEAAYLETPIRIDEIAKSLTIVERANASAVHIVPGVCSMGEPGKVLPEVMRGEETQVAGILSLLGGSESAENGDWLIGLPGTHSKWVQVRQKQIRSFMTFITGEMYGLLTRYSIVAKAQGLPACADQEAFEAGLRVVDANEAGGGLLSTIFSTRSKRMLGYLREEQQASYLSGLLIGEELAGVEQVLAHGGQELNDFSRLLLAGDAELCAKYRVACGQRNWPAVEVVEGATERGLWRVACKAKLVK